MFGLLAVIILSYSYSVTAPFAFVTKISVISMLYLLLLTSFAVLRFSQPMDEGVFFRAVIRVLAFIAICGLGAFVGPIRGSDVVSLSAHFCRPSSLLSLTTTSSFRFGDSSLFKANGFFLVEPSVFSQFMAIGLACEWVNQRRPWLVGLFLFALFSAVSGTGWLAVGGFVVYIGLTSGSRGIVTAIGFTCVCVLAFIAIGFFFPEVAETLTGRVGEFGVQGSSGNGRFVTPFLVTSYIYDLSPEAFFTGVGPGSSDSFSVISYVYGLNTPIKILLEYGIRGSPWILGTDPYKCAHTAPERSFSTVPGGPAVRRNI